MPYFIDESEWLAHHGVKGMKWGQHLFGRDRGGSRKVVKVKSSPPPLNSKAAFANLWGAGAKKNVGRQPVDRYRGLAVGKTPEKQKAIDDWKRKTRNEDYEERRGWFENDIRKVSKNMQKIDRELFEAGEDFRDIAYGEWSRKNYDPEVHKRLARAAENKFNAYAKAFVAIRDEINTAEKRGDSDRLSAARELGYAYNESFNGACRNDFSGGESIAISWSNEKVPFKFNGKTLMQKKCSARPVPLDQWEKYVDEIWDMQDMNFE